MSYLCAPKLVVLSHHATRKSLKVWYTSTSRNDSGDGSTNTNTNTTTTTTTTATRSSLEHSKNHTETSVSSFYNQNAVDNSNDNDQIIIPPAMTRQALLSNNTSNKYSPIQFTTAPLLFHLVHTTDVQTCGSMQQRCIESIFFHHPNARVKLHIKHFNKTFPIQYLVLVGTTYRQSHMILILVWNVLWKQRNRQCPTIV